MPILWRLGIAVVVLLGTALHAYAQESPLTCPECAPLERTVAQDRRSLDKAQEALQEANNEFDQAHAAWETAYAKGDSRMDLASEADAARKKVAAARARVSELLKTFLADEKALLDCRVKCAKRGPLPLMPPEIPVPRHLEPVASCPACADAALDALRAAERVAHYQWEYDLYRRFADDARDWLSGKTVGDDKEYLEKLEHYVYSLMRMFEAGQKLKEAMQAFESAMSKLADCNANLCKDSPKETVLPAWDWEEPKAACHECDPKAASLKGYLLLLRQTVAELAALTAEQTKLLSGKGGLADLTAAQRRRFDQLDKDVNYFLTAVARDEKEVEQRRTDLINCNASCTTGKPVVPGTASGRPGLGGGASAPGTQAPGGAGGPAETGGKGATGTAPTAPPTTTPPAITPPSAPPLPPRGAPPQPLGNVEPLGNIVVPIGPGAAPPLIPAGQDTAMGFDLSKYLAPLSLPSFEAPPTDLQTGDSFTFVVPNAFVAMLVLDDLRVHVIGFDLVTGEYLMRTDSGVDPELASSYLESLVQIGLISEVERDPCFVAASAPATKESLDKVVHLSGTFGATLFDPVQRQPVVGAFILVGPVPPTPFFNPGERSGDDQPPTVSRTDSSGAYTASLAGLTGAIEISVAKGCDSHSSFAISDVRGNAPPPSAGRP